MTDAANLFARLHHVDLPAAGRKSPVKDAHSNEKIVACAT